MPRSKTERWARHHWRVGNLTILCTSFKFGKMVRMSKDDPFKLRTREEVDMQWARAAVSVVLSISSFHNKEVHRVVLMTAECVENYNYRLTSWSYVTVTVCGGGT